LSGNEIEAYNAASNKIAEIVYSVDKYPICHIYNYGFNVIRYLCCCKHISLFFDKPMGGVVADRVLQT